MAGLSLCAAAFLFQIPCAVKGDEETPWATYHEINM